MEVAKIIFYTSTIVYLLPPFRQYKGAFFYFFLILAVTDPVVFLVRKFAHIEAFSLYIGFSILYYFALTQFRSLKINYFAFGLIIISIVYFSTFASVELCSLAVFSVHIFITITVLKIIAEYVLEKRELNLFHFILLLYEMNVLIKFIAVIGGFQSMLFFYFTGFLNIPIALYFAFFTVESPLFKIKILK